MKDYDIYRCFKGEPENPFDSETQSIQHIFWFYESCFEREFIDKESSDWFAFFGGFNSKISEKFMGLLSEEDYERPTKKKKAAIFDIWLNDYLFVDKLYGEYGDENEYKKSYHSITAR